MTSTTTNKKSALVVGATGATGRLVVQQLLNHDFDVHVIVRSKQRMEEYIPNDILTSKKDHLHITEASFLDLTEKKIQEHVSNVDCVVSCLGHNLSFSGIWGKPRRLVTDATKRIVKALAGTKGNKRKFILMSSDGVTVPTDNQRTRTDRFILFLLRHLIPPHKDNEEAAAVLSNTISTGNMDWVAVRPTDLVDDPEGPTEYKIMDKPNGGLFGSGVISRANVAKFMVDLLTDEKLFENYKMKFPVVHNKDITKKEEAKKSK